MPGKTDEEYAVEIYALWPNKDGSRQKGLKFIKSGIAYYRAQGDLQPGETIKARTLAYLAWRDRELGKQANDPRHFVPALCMAQTWFGDEQRRYTSANADPAPEIRVTLPSGEVVSGAQRAEDGWTVAEVA